MKKLLNIILIASFSMAGCYTTGRVSHGETANYNYSDSYDNSEVTYQTFYNQLQPYGNWINNAEYGNIWQPYASKGFRPYETSGHWVSTVDGWAWASDYNWGWAPFHYGRWLFDQSIGWAWVPGYEWAPAWVTWGQYNNYYAWAPLAPGINISFGNAWRAPSNYWSFVPRNYINYSNLNRYTVRNNYNTNVNNITIINNYNSYNQTNFYYRGPDYREVERFTHRSITPIGIASAQQPGPSRVRRNEFEIYRPSRSANNVSSPNAANGTRQYNGAVRSASPNQEIINRPDAIRNNESLNLKKVRPEDRNGLINGNNNSGTVTQESIENGNRRLQQQQMENFRNNKRQIPPVNSAETPGRPARIQRSVPDVQQSNQQNSIRQQVFRNNPLENNQPVRPQPEIQDQRIQRPAMPQQTERTIRPSQSVPMPDRSIERREANPPVRSMQIERPINRSVQKPR